MKTTVLFEANIHSIKKQVLFSDDKNVYLAEIFNLIDSYSATSYLKAAPTSYLQANLFGNKFRTALLTDTKAAKVVLDKIKKTSWDENHFKLFKQDVNSWIKNLEEYLDNPEILVQQVKNNKQDTKVKKLKESELLWL